MEIPANAPALFILGAEQMEGQIAQRLLGFAEAHFRSLLLRDFSLESLLSLHSLRKISSYLAEADQLSRFIVDRGDDHVRPEAGPVVAYAPTFIFESAFLGGHFQFPLRLACPQVLLGIETREVGADNLRSLVALDAFCSPVPTGDMTLGIKHEDRVVAYRFD